MPEAIILKVKGVAHAWQPHIEISENVGFECLFEMDKNFGSV